jgi:hypothetical protein
MDITACGGAEVQLLLLGGGYAPTSAEQQAKQPPRPLPRHPQVEVGRA